MASQAFIEAFKVPSEALDVVDQMIKPAVQGFLAKQAGQPFSAQEVAGEIEQLRGEKVMPEEVDLLLRYGYEHGFLNLVDEQEPRYEVADFFVFLDVFSVREQETYSAFPAETRKALNELYLERYVGGLDRMADTPTLDEVVPLEEMVRRIEEDERQIYLSHCDCRCLAGDCEKPTLTCLSYRTVPGSYASRKISQPISKEQAVQVVRQADKAGLMHTANPYGGICNCCSDCCYLFRAQREIGSAGRWPIVKNRAVLAEDACIHCGLCVKRCPFELFVLQDKKHLLFEQQNCVGCGLCVNTCPTGALSLMKLEGGGDGQEH